MKLPITLGSAMNGYTRLAPISRRTFLVGAGLLVAGCSLPNPGDLTRSLPALPTNLDEIEGLMQQFGLPDLSTLGDVPGLEALAGLETPPGALAFQGPLDVSLEPGQTIPATDMRLRSATGDAAEFEIAGMTAPRRLGDSLDFDGVWPGVANVQYNLRLRVYYVAANQVRAAGVQRVVIGDVQPQAASVELRGEPATFAYMVAANTGDLFPGMTLGYAGQDTRGAVLTGLPEGEYPYRKLGDSVVWKGRLRADIEVEYQLRMLYYQDNSARIGGIALISLPRQ